MKKLKSLEICVGAGGLALGLEQAGFEHFAVFDNDQHAISTINQNRPGWNPQILDVRELCGFDFKGIDLFAGGVPCPPFSIAGKQLGENDERDLFPQVLRLASEIEPKAILVENVKGFMSPKFDLYRSKIKTQLSALGYNVFWRVLNASDYGVPQLRPRFFLVALQSEYAPFFDWPEPLQKQVTVADAIQDLMSAGGWGGYEEWLSKSNRIAPTLVGGSKKHGGADLGPTRAKLQWKMMGVDGSGIANSSPDVSTPPGVDPKLTIKMVSRVQGFPDDWTFSGGKTAQYRQIGNAVPPPVGFALGCAVNDALNKVRKATRKFKVGDEPRQVDLF